MVMKVATLERLGEFLTECKALFASQDELSKVAKSGSYNDLTDKPSIGEFIATDNGNGRVTLSMGDGDAIPVYDGVVEVV